MDEGDVRVKYIYENFRLAREHSHRSTGSAWIRQEADAWEGRLW